MAVVVALASALVEYSPCSRLVMSRFLILKIRANIFKIETKE
jgi:hypothetical protein